MARGKKSQWKECPRCGVSDDDPEATEGLCVYCERDSLKRRLKNALRRLREAAAPAPKAKRRTALPGQGELPSSLERDLRSIAPKAKRRKGAK